MTERSEAVLLIGGCGYVGSALHEHLFKGGWHVESIDLEWFGNGVNRRNVRRDYAHLTQEDLAPYGTVILLAGHSSVGMCEGNRRAAFRNNVLNFVELLDELRPDQRLIYASSASVYGRTRERAATEDDALGSPATYYDLTKQEIEHYAQLSGLRCYGLRLGTVNGVARHLRGDLMLNRMVSAYMTSGVVGVSNPEVHRPILGLSDLVHAVERLLVVPEAKPGIYNLASFNATVGELAERAADLLRAEVALRPRGAAQLDVSMSTARFASELDFTFDDTVESITGSLLQGWERSRVTTREKGRTYA